MKLSDRVADFLMRFCDAIIVAIVLLLLFVLSMRSATTGAVFSVKHPGYMDRGRRLQLIQPMLPVYFIVEHASGNSAYSKGDVLRNCSLEAQVKKLQLADGSEYELREGLLRCAEQSVFVRGVYFETSR